MPLLDPLFLLSLIYLTPNSILSEYRYFDPRNAVRCDEMLFGYVSIFIISELMQGISEAI